MKNIKRVWLPADQEIGIGYILKLSDDLGLRKGLAQPDGRLYRSPGYIYAAPG